MLENCISIKQLVAHRGMSFWVPLHYSIAVYRHYGTDKYEQVMQALLLILCLTLCQHTSHNIHLY